MITDQRDSLSRIDDGDSGERGGRFKPAKIDRN